MSLNGNVFTEIDIIKDWLLEIVLVWILVILNAKDIEQRVNNGFITRNVNSLTLD
jgi:hypothetical protein